jgi:hypothetical protein
VIGRGWRDGTTGGCLPPVQKLVRPELAAGNRVAARIVLCGLPTGQEKGRASLNLRGALFRLPWREELVESEMSEENQCLSPVFDVNFGGITSVLKRINPIF